MADPTTDISHKDRMAFMLRFVEINEETFEVKPRDAFLCFKKKKACNTDAKKIVDVLFNRFGLDSSFLVGQFYYGASAVSGHVGGMQQKLKA